MRYSQARERLIRSLRREIWDQRVLQAMAAVPRELFVPPEMAAHAYEDTALPIGEGQTISQPLIVGVMLQALQVAPTDKVLDVGTGSGYQAAILAHLAAEVVSVERIPALRDRAMRTLERLGYANVRVYLAQDVLGWPQEAPYNGIVVGAAAPSVPRVLLDQLADGGRLVIPVGTPFEQNLARVVKRGERTEVTWLGPCRFVHLIGEDGWPGDEPGPEEVQ